MGDPNCHACKASSPPHCANHPKPKASTSLEMDKAAWRDVDDDERGVSTWETMFLESTRRQLEHGRPLTDKQRAKLQEIRDGQLSKGVDDAGE